MYLTYNELNRKPKPRYGEYAVYAAIALLCFGIIGMAWGAL